MAPKQKPGKSFQDYGTPRVFLDAIFDSFWIRSFAVDLAASPENAVCDTYLTKEQDSLVQPWAEMLKSPGAWGWLNPPYAKIGQWVRKAAEEASLGGAHIMVLVPASTGANWWRDYVHNQCRIRLLNGRLTFVGQKDPYPKDCALLLYGPNVGPGYEVWTWNKKD